MKKLMLSLVVLAMSATTVSAQCPTKAGKCDAPKACAEIEIPQKLQEFMKGEKQSVPISASLDELKKVLG